MHVASLPSERAGTRPDKPCLSDETVGTLTNQACAARLETASRALATHGAARGTVAAVRLPNRVNTVVTLFTACRPGAAVTPVNPAPAHGETEYQITDSTARVPVTHDGLSPEGVTTLAPEHLAAPCAGADADPAEPDLDDLAPLVGTSGTTAPPKGVELTDAGLDAMTGTMVEALSLGERDHSLLILPLFHVNGIVVSILPPLRAGGQATIAGRFDPHTFFATLETVRPAYLPGIPAICAMLANLPAEVEPDTGSLRFVACAAAPTPAALIRRAEERFGVVLIAGHGLSEGTCASTSNPLDGVRKPGTVGVALLGQTVAVMAPDDTLVPTGERGEIEHTIHAHPAVLEAAVVGRPHPVMGEEPAAFVAPREGALPDEDELVAFLTQRTAKDELPTSVTFVDEVPNNPPGKFDKAPLRAAVAATHTAAAGPDEETP